MCAAVCGGTCSLTGATGCIVGCLVVVTSAPAAAGCVIAAFVTGSTSAAVSSNV